MRELVRQEGWKGGRVEWWKGGRVEGGTLDLSTLNLKSGCPTSTYVSIRSVGLFIFSFDPGHQIFNNLA